MDLGFIAVLSIELVGVNADLLLSFALVLELHGAVDEGKQRVVLANANILTCANGASALSDDNVACKHVLTVGLLHTKTLGLAIAAVLSGTYTFLMSKEL